ncbi:tyrosine-type recombinase/integrase [Actinomadura rupiterrae]|uniref:tyrosine-type recombinase/integrase n=1 Tax=Actinomadura rupiterrae TaxID=559627 RepID=UPI0020A2A452|nr:tyrosine-type recombinase/integrase [Actinomadura rupiterrae]MCP2343138.1 integrase/recombinase XerC [Actinomadura rupiterrae]
MTRRRQQVPDVYAGVHTDYAAALAGAPLDADTRRAYDSRVRAYLAWLDATGELDGGDPLADAHARDFAARDYKTHLKTVLGRSDHTVNAHLTALDHFYDHLGLGKVGVRRAPAPRQAPRALTARQQKSFLRAVERCPLARDRAIGRLLFYSGIRVSELVALDLDDVPISARKGAVRVRAGKGELARQVPLTDPTARTAVAEWKTDRAHWRGADTAALLLNRRGGRLSARAVDQLLDDIAIEAGLVDEHGTPTVSAHILRHTFATNLLRAGVDIVIVAELLGHARLDTTRRYTLPTPTDLEDAVAHLPTDQ